MREVSKRVENVDLTSLDRACNPEPGPAPPSLGLHFFFSSWGPCCAPMSPWALVTPRPFVLSSSPFDTEIFLVSPSPTVKFSVGSRKGSLYNWTPPSTPSFRERYYLVSGPGTLWLRKVVGVRVTPPGASTRTWAEQPGTSGRSKWWVQPLLVLGYPGYFLYLSSSRLASPFWGLLGLVLLGAWNGVLWVVLPPQPRSWPPI